MSEQPIEETETPKPKKAAKPKPETARDKARAITLAKMAAAAK